MELRLFPLSEVVLFPGMILRLQVFETRYRQLVAECLQRNEPFGVALIRDGDEVGRSAVPYDLGTTARIKSAATGADGQLHLVTLGGRRFRVRALHHDRPYLWADVEYPPEESGVVRVEPIERAHAGLERVIRLRQAIDNDFERGLRVPQAPGALADAIAALAEDQTPEELQRLLELTNVAERLEAVLPLLESVLAGTHREAAEVTAARWSGFGMGN